MHVAGSGRQQVIHHIKGHVLWHKQPAFKDNSTNGMTHTPCTPLSRTTHTRACLAPATCRSTGSTQVLLQLNHTVLQRLQPSLIQNLLSFKEADCAAVHPRVVSFIFSSRPLACACLHGHAAASSCRDGGGHSPGLHSAPAQPQHHSSEVRHLPA